MRDPDSITLVNVALRGRYRIGRELGEVGMAYRPSSRMRSRAHLLGALPGGVQYGSGVSDVSSDDDRLVAIRFGASGIDDRLVPVRNFFEELNRFGCPIDPEIPWLRVFVEGVTRR